MTVPDCPIRPALLGSLLCHALLLGAVALSRAGLPQSPARAVAGVPTTLELVFASPAARPAVTAVPPTAANRPVRAGPAPTATAPAASLALRSARHRAAPAAMPPAGAAAATATGGEPEPAAAGARPASPVAAMPRAEPDSELPSYLAAASPVYPAWSRDHGEQGRVLVRVTVTADGTVEAVAVAQGSGYPQLDRAALESVRSWRFRPARQHGVARRAAVIVPVRFSLSDD